jgi:hypothetical protein
VLRAMAAHPGCHWLTTRSADEHRRDQISENATPGRSDKFGMM